MVFRESHSCLAIRPRFRTAGRLSFERQPGQQTCHCLTTGRVGIDDLAEKHPKRHQLRIDRLRRFGLRPSHVAEHVGGQQIDKGQPLLLPQRIPDRTDLPRNAFPSTMVHVGLLAGFQGSFVDLHNPCRQGWPFFAISFAPNHLRPRKCHWGCALGGGGHRGSLALKGRNGLLALVAFYACMVAAPPFPPPIVRPSSPPSAAMRSAWAKSSGWWPRLHVARSWIQTRSDSFKRRRSRNSLRGDWCWPMRGEWAKRPATRK